jgi:phosphoglycolate phosphatase
MLILWDVDHTLVESGGVGRELYHQAFAAVTGVAVRHDVDVTGKTERAIFIETARAHGVDTSDDLAHAYRSELARQYELHLDDLQRRGRALPYARDTLAALAKRSDVVQTVLTGNYRLVAELKLRAFDLQWFLDVESGAYGEDALDRADLLPFARSRSVARHPALDTAKVVVVGDSPADIQATAGRATVVAVASGSSSQEALRQAGADVVLPTLATLAPLLSP